MTGSTSGRSARVLVFAAEFLLAIAMHGLTSPVSAQSGRPSLEPVEAIQDTPLRIPDRVLVNYGGTWYPGSIYAVKNGKYKVLRDDYSSDDRWVTSAELKRPTLVAATRPQMALPGSIPNGVYTCETILSGAMSGGPTAMTIGKIGVVGKGVYTSLVKEGTGSRAAFTYDPASGRIDWDGGKVAGFLGRVVKSSLAFDKRGKPVIQVTYTVREGGNLLDLSCR
ncbi:MAG TPA: hypothetical protein VHM24_13570 [Gemmatimonadaceae bacterium]|nr:hypothetical protein [Gemmatimonadaceae bacterium]